MVTRLILGAVPGGLCGFAVYYFIGVISGVLPATAK